jgi:hypothetical protein
MFMLTEGLIELLVFPFLVKVLLFSFLKMMALFLVLLPQKVYLLKTIPLGSIELLYHRSELSILSPQLLDRCKTLLVFSGSLDIIMGSLCFL